jgi:hypothetical protein
VGGGHRREGGAIRSWKWWDRDSDGIEEFAYKAKGKTIVWKLECESVTARIPAMVVGR